MSNELDDGVLVNVLRKGVAVCGYIIILLGYNLFLCVYHNLTGSMIPTEDTTLIQASRLGHVYVVRCLLKYGKTAFGVEYVQKFTWAPNRKKKTAFDEAVKKGHVEVAKLLLENLSLECLVSKRNHEGKLLVSMLNPRHDNIILDTFDKATNAVTNPLAITSITIHEEDLRQESPQVCINSIMGPQSYPQSHIHGTQTSLLKLDKGEVELTPNKNTILHLASKTGHVIYVREILAKHPSLLYHRNSEGETPAYVAAREGHLDILIVMINYFRMKNDDIESLVIRSIDNHNALHIAIQNHHVGVVFWLIKEVPRLANLVNNFSESPIYLAAERRYYHILKHILTKCETKSFEGPKGKTALHAAAISGSGECIKYLHEEIDQYIRDEQGWTPLQYAVHHNNLLATKKLVDANPSIVNEITKEDDKDTSASRDEHGWTPFRYAVYHNNASATAELVDADPLIVHEIIKEDDINTFAVHIAASRGYWETLKVLMSHCPGCSELLDGKGKNIFHVAVENKQIEVIKLIYRDESYTSLVNQKDIDGNTPVHLLLTASDDFKMMDLVIDTRVNINVLNNEKLTPLEIASSYDKRKRLLEGIAMVRKGNEKNEKEKRDDSKLVENFLIVATLIATASFGAAFTVPGGFNGNEGSEQGMPILLRKAAFKAFMISNTIAFSCSITCILLRVINLLELFGVALVDIRHVARAMAVFIQYAMWAMMVAFATGIYVVLTPYTGLAISLCTLTIALPYSGTCIVIFGGAFLGHV